jgi:hypothetical protein
MIAGQNIIYLPGTIVLADGYMHGYISTTDHRPAFSPWNKPPARCMQQ